MTGRLRVEAEANNNRTDLHSLISATVDCCICKIFTLLKQAFNESLDFSQPLIAS